MNKFILYKLNRGIWTALLKQNKLSEAVENFKAYIKNLENFEKTDEIESEINCSKKIFIENLTELSEKYLKNKDYANALICYQNIFEHDSNNTEIIKQYINCLDTTSQFDLELILAEHYHKISDSSDSLKILSKLYDKNNRFNEALDCYEKYMKKEHKQQLDINDNTSLGCVYFNKYIRAGQNPDDAKKALEHFKIVSDKYPNNKIYLKNTIVAAMKAKDFKTEKKCWEYYLKNNFADAEDIFTYSASCMRNGDIEGWKKYYNSRFNKKEKTIYPKMDKPEWKGEDIHDKILLIHYEQGYGDNFLMFGYMPRIVKLAKHVIYYIQNNAYELVKNNDFGVEVFCQKVKDLNDIKFDYHIPCMSIPIALNLNKDNISVGGGYIKPDSDNVKFFKEKYFNTKKLKIGLSFAGINSNSKRDIPINELKKLDSLENVEFYCLTKDIPDKTLNHFKNNKITNIAKEFNTFADTAGAIENTDIIVSSDNCILNLAGAMGKKTLGVFNYHYEFRWYDLTGDDSGWYKSVKPIVNNEYNDWSLSIKKVIAEIKNIQKINIKSTDR